MPKSQNQDVKISGHEYLFVCCGPTACGGPRSMRTKQIPGSMRTQNIRVTHGGKASLPERRRMRSTPARGNTFAQEGLHIGHRNHLILHGRLLWKQANQTPECQSQYCHQRVLPWPGVVLYFHSAYPKSTSSRSPLFDALRRPLLCTKALSLHFCCRQP